MELEPTKILAVDDVEENLVAISAVLKRPELTVLWAKSGTEALEVLLAHDVALALVDVQMPEMNGFELAELMRGAERSRHVPIIFVTAEHGEPTRVFKGYEAGAVDFLFKPLDAELLRSKVDVFVQLHRQRQTLSANVKAMEEMLTVSDLFIAALGHDLRSPLASIKTNAELLLARGDGSELAHKSARRIRQSADRMARLIQQLLDFARARVKGTIPLHVEDANLGALLRIAVGELDSERAAQVRQEVRGALDGVWDSDRILQVMVNLLSNALEHGSADQPVAVRIDGTQAERVSLEVANAGVIPPEIRGRLFDPFKPKSGRSPGLGLGLYIVDQIVKSHGGTVAVESEEATGTRFRVELPRRTELSGH